MWRCRAIGQDHVIMVQYGYPDTGGIPAGVTGGYPEGGAIKTDFFGVDSSAAKAVLLFYLCKAIGSAF